MLQTLTYTLALNWALRPIVKWKLSFLSFRGGEEKFSARCSDGREGRGLGGGRPCSWCLPWSPSSPPTISSRLPPSCWSSPALPRLLYLCTSSSCRSSLPTCWPDRGLQMSAWNLILISWLRSSGVQGRKNVYILIYCSYLICNLKWNQGNPVGRQAVGIPGIHYLSPTSIIIMPPAQKIEADTNVVCGWSVSASYNINKCASQWPVLIYSP